MPPSDPDYSDELDDASTARFHAQMDRYGRMLVPRTERKRIDMQPGWYAVIMIPIPGKR